VTAIHPRRRPQKGGTYRSIKGDHITLNAHGACARVTSPTIRMSTPLSRIQSGMAYQTTPSGSPDENDSSDTAAVRHERIARTRFANAPPAPRDEDVTVSASPCRTSERPRVARHDRV